MINKRLDPWGGLVAWRDCALGAAQARLKSIVKHECCVLSHHLPNHPSAIAHGLRQSNGFNLPSSEDPGLEIGGALQHF
jgi:hypothetical protein